jgi:xanthine dehydrogenase accessory factor
MRDFYAKSVAALARDGVAVLVTVVEERGSVPREVGAQMLVTASGFLGSIGGGTLEWKAMAEAQGLLGRNARPGAVSFQKYVLGPDLGQCCGGQVQLRFELHTEAAQLQVAMTANPPTRRIALFGAGHVGRALVLVLAQSEFDVTWVDPRPDAFPAATPGNVTLHTGDPLKPLLAASLAIVMSHSHALDFDITDAGLRLPHIARVLLIGSATKRARFLSRLRAAGHGEARLKDLICPIGGGALRSKKPYAIAISTAQQILALDESLRLPQTGEATVLRA